MDIKKLHYFIAVAEELHFNRAAEKLNMTQPPLSQQIQALEEELGVKLLERNKRQVRMTAAGAVFLEEAKLILSQLERSIQTTQLVSQGMIGNLNLAFVDSAAGGILIDVIKRFREKFPQIKLTLSEQTSSQQWQALESGTIHMAFLRSIAPAMHIGYKEITSESLVIVLPEHHPLAKLTSVSVSSLAKEPFIVSPRRQGAAFHDLILRFCAQHDVYPNIMQEAIQMYTIVNLVAANLGIAIVPSSVAVFQRSGVVFRPFVEPTPAVPLYAAWRNDSNKEVLAAFIKTMDEVCSKDQDNK